jgi:hypothetical protein
MKEINDQNNRELISSQEEYLEMRTALKNTSLLILHEVGLVRGLENILIDEIRAEYEIYFLGVVRVMNALISIERTYVQ